MHETLTLPSGARLTAFPTEKPTQLGVLVLPGGGYHVLATDHEGRDVADWLNQRGYDAWMLEYTVVGENQNEVPLHPRPITDALEAVRFIRAQKPEQKLGVWGFSAGGHLAATLSTEPEAGLDFSILAYPVISTLGGWTHEGSGQALIGSISDATLTAQWAMENRINAQTPPAFIFHTTDDDDVDVRGALIYAAQLAKNGVAFELHVYENGEHGVGLAPDDPILRSWPGRLEQWLEKR